MTSKTIIPFGKPSATKTHNDALIERIVGLPACVKIPGNTDDPSNPNVNTQSGEAIKTAKLAHTWVRAEDEWYQEPEDCTTALLSVERFVGNIWDPACGGGNIVSAITSAGRFCWGTDIVERGAVNPRSWGGCKDFLDLPAHKFMADNIITNPPFARGLLTEAFIRHALASPAIAKLATFVDTRFLCSGKRAMGLYAELPPSRVWILSPRPSCPPGDYLAAGNKAGGGTADYCWLVWDQTAPASPTELRWLRRS